MTADTWLTVFKGLLYTGTVLVAIATIGMSIYSTKVDTSKDQKIDDLLAGSKQLQAGNQELLVKIATYQADLAAKQQEIEALKTNAVKAGRGQYAAWDFNGIRREAAQVKSIQLSVTRSASLKRSQNSRNRESTQILCALQPSR